MDNIIRNLKEKVMNDLTIYEVRVQYYTAIVNYLVAMNHWTVRENNDWEFEQSVENIFRSGWQDVKKSFEAKDVRTDGLTSDFTCDFICRMLSKH